MLIYQMFFFFLFRLGMSSNRPNSRNSLNSRLSSSHNSLSVSSANKPDDSIFITQAMSHDALLTREISDFYNVPIDSDIYALPVDMIKSEKERSKHSYRHNASESFGVHEAKEMVIQSNCNKHNILKCHHQTKSNRKNRNKRKKRASSNCVENGGGGCGGGGESSDRAPSHISTSTTSRYTSTFVSTSSIQDETNVNANDSEPLHMTLDEVKQFYHTLYSDTKPIADGGGVAGGGGGTSQRHFKNANPNLISKSSNETIWSGSTVRSRSSNSTLAQNRTDKNVSLHSNKINVASQKHFASDTETHANNNNNNMTAINNHNNQNQNHSPQTTGYHHSQDKDQTSQNSQTILKSNIISPSEKKSQFTLNLKQKFCSIFRFRRNHNRCSSRSVTNDGDENMSNSEKVTNISKSNEDKRKKFQSRALPPLPKKGKYNIDECL